MYLSVLYQSTDVLVILSGGLVESSGPLYMFSLLPPNPSTGLYKGEKYVTRLVNSFCGTREVRGGSLGLGWGERGTNLNIVYVTS